jgi:hypothetical protein
VTEVSLARIAGPARGYARFVGTANPRRVESTDGATLMATSAFDDESEVPVVSR